MMSILALDNSYLPCAYRSSAENISSHDFDKITSKNNNTAEFNSGSLRRKLQEISDKLARASDALGGKDLTYQEFEEIIGKENMNDRELLSAICCDTSFSFSEINRLYAHGAYGQLCNKAEEEIVSRTGRFTPEDFQELLSWLSQAGPMERQNPEWAHYMTASTKIAVDYLGDGTEGFYDNSNFLIAMQLLQSVAADTSDKLGMRRFSSEALAMINNLRNSC